jgi:hypothetical protein
MVNRNFIDHLPAELNTTVDEIHCSSAGRRSAEAKPEDLPDQKQHSAFGRKAKGVKASQRLYLSFFRKQSQKIF